jgi:hypothetical protein
LNLLLSSQVLLVLTTPGLFLFLRIVFPIRTSEPGRLDIGSRNCTRPRLLGLVLLWCRLIFIVLKIELDRVQLGRGVFGENSGFGVRHPDGISDGQAVFGASAVLGLVVDKVGQASCNAQRHPIFQGSRVPAIENEI